MSRLRMGTPKYKNYPIGEGEKVLKDGTLEESQSQSKVLKLKEEIKNLLQTPEKKDLAAKIISDWINKSR